MNDDPRRSLPQGKCPRCGFEAHLLAMSRTDNKTMICPACGNDEGVQAHQNCLSPQAAWPVEVDKIWYDLNRLAT